MQIKVRLFSVLRERAGKEECDVVLPHGTSTEEALICLRTIFQFSSAVLGKCLMAVNGVYLSETRSLKDGDELAILPPVSGG